MPLNRIVLGRKQIGVLVAALVGFAPLSALAEQQTDDDKEAKAQADFEQKSPHERLDVIDKELDDLAATLKLDNVTDVQLAAARDKIGPINDQIDGVINELEPQLADAKARLDELGKAPAAGEAAESAEVRAERKDQEKHHQELDDGVTRAHLLGLRAGDLSDSIAKRRRDMFSAQLSARTSSILGITFWRDIRQHASLDYRRFHDRYSEGVAVLEVSLVGEGTRLIVICAIALLIATLGARLAEHAGRKLAMRFLADTRLRRTLVALWTIITMTGVPVMAALLVADTLRDTKALSPLFTTMIGAAVVGVRVLSIILGLSRAYLAPGCPQWRLVNWTDAQVSKLRGLPVAIAITIALRVLWERTNDAVGTSLPVAILGRSIFAFIIITLFALALYRTGRVRQEQLTTLPVARPGDRAAASAVPAALLSGLAWIALAIASVSLLIGFNALAIFLVREVIQISLVLAALLLLIRLADDLFTSLLSEHFPIGRFLRRAVGLHVGYINQIAVMLSGLSRVVLIYVAIRLILLRLGGEDVTSVAGRIQDGLADLKVGEVTISPGAILGSVLVFSGVWFLTRTVRHWLEGSYLPHTTLDSGARNSLSTGVGYLGFIAAVLMAVAYLGVSLDKVALIASALSVGVGFGLQAIISNFVSGLILLVERPIKVGDLVNVSGSTGDVKKISVRATEITLGDGSTFVVPNSDLISKPVVNKTRFGVLGQVQFLLRIAYGEDPNRARAAVLDEIGRYDKVLKTPGPSVFVDDVDDRGYVFNIVASVGSPRDTYGARSDLFFAITRRLREEHIALGSPIASVASDQGAAGAPQNGATTNDTAATDTSSTPLPEPMASAEPEPDRPALGDGKGRS